MEKSFIITGYLKTRAAGTDRSLYAAMVSEVYFLEMNGRNNFSAAVMLHVNSDANSGDVKNLISEIAAEFGLWNVLWIYPIIDYDMAF